MNVASKVDAILNAWFDYIALDDYSKARIEANSDAVQQRGVNLLRDKLLIEPDIFSQLQQKATNYQIMTNFQ